MTIAAVSTILSVVRGMRPGQMGDLEEIRTWLVLWRTGISPYEALQTVDYPPHAFGVLWLAGFGSGAAPPIYAMIGGVVGILTAWALVRWFHDLAGLALTRWDVLSLTSMIVAARATRRAIEWGQTAPLALLLFVAAMLLARRRPVLAGVLFGLASFKLNLAIGFGLIWVLFGAWVPLAVAGLTVAAQTLWFAWSLRMPLDDLLNDYLGNIAFVYGGQTFLHGVTGLRSVMAALIDDYTLVQFVYPLIVGLLLGGVLTQWFLHPPRTPRDRTMAAVMALLWALLSVTYQRYSTSIVFPVFWLLQRESLGLELPRPWRSWVPAVGLFLMIIHLPYVLDYYARLWALVPDATLDRIAGYTVGVGAHSTRTVVVIGFGWLFWRRGREMRALADRGRGDEHAG